MGALLLYDITNKKSFENCKDWLERLHEDASDDLVIMLIGNKIDLAAQREVSTNEGMNFAQENELAFLETSALTGSNVNIAFSTIINRKCD